MFMGGKVTFRNVSRLSDKVSAEMQPEVFSQDWPEALCVPIKQQNCHSNPTDAEGATPAVSAGLAGMLKCCRCFHIRKGEDDIWPIGPMGTLEPYPTGTASGWAI